MLLLCCCCCTPFHTSREFLYRVAVIQPVVVAESARVPRIGVSAVAATTRLHIRERGTHEGRREEVSFESAPELLRIIDKTYA